MSPSTFSLFAPLLTLASATLLAVWSGWGLTRLTLPTPLRPLSSWLTPLIGYVFNLVVSYWWFRTTAGLGYALFTIVVSGAVLNILAWRRDGGIRIGRPTRDVWALLVLLLVSLGIGIAPQLHYAEPAPIGGGWDTENYLPTAVYAQRGSLAEIPLQLENPLRDANADPARNGLTLGFSLTLGLVTLPIGQPVLYGFTPLLAWLRVLGLLAVYVTFRQLLALRPWPALAGTALTAAGSLLLWVSYFNFGMQLSAWPLLPLSLLLGAVTLPELARGAPRTSAIPLVLTAAALPICYYPVLGSIAGPALALGALLMVVSPQRLRLFTAALATAAAASVLAAPTMVDYFAGFSYRYSLPLTTLGIFRFIPLEQIVGLQPFLFRADAAPRDLTIWGGLLLWGAVSGYGLWRGTARGPLLALLLGTLAFLLQIRFGSQYHYGYLKAAAYAGWVAAAAVAAGLQALSDTPRRAAAWAALPLALLLLAQTAGAQLRVVQAHWEQPGLYGDELPQLLALRELVPAGASVRFSGDPRPAGTSNGLAAMLLDHARVWGSVGTGYTSSQAGPADQVGEFGLLQRDEEPTSLGYAAPALADLGPYRLYRRRSELVALLSTEQTLAVGENLAVTLSTQGLALAPAVPEARDGPTATQLRINLARLAPGSLTINGVRYTQPAGLSQITLPLTLLAGRLELANAEAPLLVRSLELFTATDPQAAVTTSGLVTAGRISVTAERALLELQISHRDVGPLVAALDIWDRDSGRHYGWYGVNLPAGDHQPSFSLDLQSGTMQLSGSTEPLATQFDGLQDGTYTASLRIGTNREALLRPRDLFSFSISNGVVSAALPLVNELMMAGAIDMPPQPLSVTAGEFGGLLGVSPAAAAWRSGSTQQITLWWRAAEPRAEASVLVQLFRESGERIVLADGPPAAGARPTSSWRAGEIILDTRTIELPAGLAAGRYRLRLGLYRWPELTPVALTDTAGNLLGDTLDLVIDISAD